MKYESMLKQQHHAVAIYSSVTAIAPELEMSESMLVDVLEGLFFLGVLVGVAPTLRALALLRAQRLLGRFAWQVIAAISQRGH